jgi:hypothetical protein
MSFGLTSSNLPDKIKRLLSPEDRKTLGKAGETTEEMLRNAAIKTEKDLQNVIEQYFNLKGIVAIRSRMDVPTTNNKGCPDFLVVVRSPDAIRIQTELGFRVGLEVYAIAMEVKLPGEKLSADQEEMRARMIYPPNGWRWFTVHSVAEVREALQWCGIK